VHITAAYQDEQTGGRGPTNVFDHLSAGIPKRLVLVNGEHGTQTVPDLMADRAAWLDHWLLGRHGFDGTTSRVLLGYQGDSRVVGEIASDGFPLGQTRFTDAFVTKGGLTFGTPTAGTATWVNGSRRQSYAHLAGSNTGGELTSPTGPDELELSMRFEEATAIAGPITANLFVASSAPDTELFVQLIDRAPDGTLLYLNRGLLRASHRAIDPSQSQFTADGRIYRPWPPAHRALARDPGRGRRLPDRRVPGRPRVPARPRAGRQGPRAAARRQRLRIRAEDAAGGSTRCTSGRTSRRG
jgi:uncharacterized protein